MTSAPVGQRRRHGRNGRLLVLRLVGAGLAAVAGAWSYREARRPLLVRELEEDGIPRIRAFTAILRMNGLPGLARRYGYVPLRADEAEPAATRYVRLRTSDGRDVYLLRGEDLERPYRGEARDGITVVVASDGDVIDVFEGARPYPLAGAAPGEPPVVAAVVTAGPATSGSVTTVRLVPGDPERVLRLRGPFRLETSTGTVVLDVAGEEAGSEPPWLRFLPARSCFQVEQESAEESGGVEIEASPLLCH